jgi:hypothetical protein
MPDPTVVHASAQAAATSDSKVEHGQFFTMVSPFEHPAFLEWLDAIPAGTLFIEPFAGANNLVRMVDEVRPGLDWESYDIEPQDPAVMQRDTLRDFPHAADVQAVITNPPYLAKNVASRTGLADVAVSCGTWENLYMACLEQCLTHAAWVAAIIPESFLTAGVFRDRLVSVISVDQPMFVDTEVPVCLAMWGPVGGAGIVWKGARSLGTLGSLEACWPRATDDRITFNDPAGTIALLAVDAPSGATITFCAGNTVPAAEVKVSSRHRTRISIRDLDPADTAAVIAAANRRLATLRDSTNDVGLTAFMGMRADGSYRRRLDYATARGLLSDALAEIDAAGGGPGS